MTSGPLARSSPQLVAVAWGSRSIIAVVCPASAAAVAKCTARVVLPEPPFWLTIATVFMVSQWVIALTTCPFYHTPTSRHHHMKAYWHHHAPTCPFCHIY